jgi:ankyrin repeat protein
LDVLIRKGVNVNTQDITSKTPLMKAVRNNKTDAVLRLLRAQADLNITDRNSDMALHYAARNGCRDIIDILLSGGSFIDVQNYWGRSPLMEAVCYNHRESVVRLIDANCDLDRREFKTGDTALHIAIKRNYVCVVQVLLEAGSRHDIYNHQGETAFFDAVVSNKWEVLRLMIAFNCKLDVPPKYFPDGVYKSLFQLAAEKGHLETCRMLAGLGYIDYSARVYFYTPGYVPSRPSENDDTLAWLRAAMQRVVPLQQLCRKVIRRQAGHDLPTKVEALPTPRALKDYILIKDLIDTNETSV